MNNGLKHRLAEFLLEWRDEGGGDETFRRLPAEHAIEIMLDAIDAHGYAIVPKQPTDAMARSASYNHPPSGYIDDAPEYAAKVYRAMLAIAPKVTE